MSPGARSEPGRLVRPIQIVVTPGSGNGQALRRAVRLRDALAARGHPTRIEVFADLDDLRHWAATNRGGFSLLICVGGDGTLSTAAQAAVRRSLAFLPVPSGFGNLFARALGHSRRVGRVADLVESGRVVHIDVGVRGSELFLCQESYGLLAEIQQAAETRVVRPRARWRRWLSYYQAAVRHLRDRPVSAFQVAVDGRTVARDAAIVTVANVSAYGPGLPVTPGASPVDGLLDVFCMPDASKKEILARLLRRHLRLPDGQGGTLSCRGRRVSVAGHRLAREELRVLPAALPVLVSAEAADALGRGADRPIGQAA
jgi:diacylglycerol kinase (ATP)